MHRSIYEEGKGFKVERCTACCKLFHCPLCPKYKPSQRAKLQQHLDVHIKNAIIFKAMANSLPTGQTQQRPSCEVRCHQCSV
ncbi:hypothetical protein PFLUV_G00052200 [Perca fluviatilis]|uniref:Uncharacterized protein n=1 Tax=Perca fluviatilis TaxID=8168 RepID=A0A6A5FC06_PERFL|nr:hypothetical protein PFLUV_G00052200 [Perca fluviatilis]